ncbi:hypothetical protein GIY23_22055 [Allosaccharopolyspora coralli]|uniref:Uncharacterized protein n=1 Tax=Allosaccharopolyspora coralli TaxID=2665642 RepID=A0A5Q3QCS2_9PSEU|nr:hypothetical protein GIY23_22055 [Allosaccharopolyspora coralli]
MPSPRCSGVRDVQLEPLPRLEWSLATEVHPLVHEGRSPASLRTGWVHRAPEEQVLTLFRKLGRSGRPLPAPWWLTALDRGLLPSRAAGFAVEDELHAVLGDRAGWFFVPWVETGQSGYWEYGPSDRAPLIEPTTVVLTDEHPGWANAFAAHDGRRPVPVPVNGADGLLSALPWIESW